MPLPATRNATWKWGVCGLLLLATMINYMDRQVLAQSAKRIMEELKFQEDGYGDVEGAFGLAFAFGSLTFGIIADRVNVRWVYPAGMLVWSAAGVLSGFARNYEELMYCRIALGFFEATNWPCALRVTQRLLSKDERTLGNSILQSGAAVGAIITPFVVLGAISIWNSWRPQFWFVGALGPVWITLWLLVVRSEDLSLSTLTTDGESQADSGGASSIVDVWRDRRFWILVFVVVGINATWHFFRAWLPLYLQKGRGVSEETTNFFMSGYFLFTDVGAITAGVLTLRLHTRLGLPVHRSRMSAFLIFALIVLASIPAAYTENTELVMGLFLVMGFGALGVFPNYYSFTQELSTRHQGKVTGMLGFSCWASIFVIQPTVGAYLKKAREALTAVGLDSGLDSRTAELLANQQAYGRVIAFAGVLPLLTFLALLLFWRTPRQD